MSRRRRQQEQGPGSRWRWLKDAFSIEPDYEPLTDREIALLDRIACFVVRRRLITPAVLFLESVKPMSYVGSQTMSFFEPMVKMLFAGVEYDELRRILERRQSIEVLIQRIEVAESERAGSGQTRGSPQSDGSAQSDGSGQTNGSGRTAENEGR